MRTITLEVPEDLADRLEAMPAEERNHFAVAVLRNGLADLEGERPETQEELAALVGPLSTEGMAAIGRALAEVDAGLERPADEFFDELDRELAALAKNGNLAAITKSGKD